MNTHDTNLGLLFGSFIHTQENSDVGYLFGRTIEESNEEWEYDFNDGKKIIIKMIPTNGNFGQIDLTNISYDNYPEVIQFENYVIEKIKFFIDENIVNSIECYIPIGPTYVESFMMNGKITILKCLLVKIKMN